MGNDERVERVRRLIYKATKKNPNRKKADVDVVMTVINNRTHRKERCCSTPRIYYVWEARNCFQTISIHFFAALLRKSECNHLRSFLTNGEWVGVIVFQFMCCDWFALLCGDWVVKQKIQQSRYVWTLSIGYCFRTSRYMAIWSSLHVRKNDPQSLVYIAICWYGSGLQICVSAAMRSSSLFLLTQK